MADQEAPVLQVQLPPLPLVPPVPPVPEPLVLQEPEPVAPVVAAIPFALTPAVAIDGIVDYTTSEGRKLYNSASYKLEEELYDCKPDGLYQFLQSLSTRAQEFGWDNIPNGILMVPSDSDNMLSEGENLIDNYGKISLEDIRIYEESYLTLPCRPAQDSFMLFKCLMNSITKTGKDKVTIWKAQYTVNTHASGNLLLKIIIRESHLDTNATTSNIRTKLSNLDTYVMTIGCDITKFNGYVKLLTESLAARGESMNDLLEFLFKGYGAVPDTEFTAYIKRKLENYEEGHKTIPEDLMTLAGNKYKLELENGTWNAPSPDEEKILALHAEIKNMKKYHLKKGYPHGNDHKGKPKSGDSKKKYKSEKPSWMSKPPAEGEEKKPKTWSDKPWYWCHADTGGKCTGVWRVHKPSDCEGKAHASTYTKSKTDEKKRKPHGKANDERKLKLAKAYAVIASAANEGSSSDSSASK